MSATIYEWYGYRVEDRSEVAASTAAARHCPFTYGACIKDSGACSIEPFRSGERVVICPRRLYFDDYSFLTHIAEDAFSDLLVDIGPHGRPSLVSASQARQVATTNGVSQVGVFGGAWDSEVRLPSTMGGGSGGYSVDFTLIVIDPTGELIRLTPVEVQSIDTTGSLRTSVAGLVRAREAVPSGVGLNWENVNKRILPQLIQKGLMLQAEALCTSGIYFVTPDPVFRKVMARLGGEQRFRRVPKQPGSITFVRYDYDYSAAVPDGQIMPLKQVSDFRISTSDLSIAFITPENLPASGSYATAIRRRLGIR
ncbi:NotI family restriction endonuclease [Mycobacterium avium]|uniref:NotI family restriction endonuclease n=1 Tax=Mycobacterium avium TaxID=1764 RepID=UPI000A07A5AB|nr:NotI family restriction endonuclease [Mycobacterium avium]